MKSVVWLVLLFVVAVVAATTLGSNDGLVTLYWRGWRTELSLNLFVLLFIGGCLLLMSAWQALTSLVTLPRRAAEWRALRRERAAHAALREALSETFSGRYSRARKAAEKALLLQRETPELADDGEFRVLVQLLAAGSLHRLQDRKRRDQMLKLLFAPVRRQMGSRSTEEGARLLAAEWALEDRDPVRAQDMLRALPPGAARRMQALRLRLQAARLGREPMEALHTARLLANHQGLSNVVAPSLLRSLAFEVLDDAHDTQQLRRIWSQLDAADRRDAHVAARAAQRAVSLGATEDARQWLRPFWDRLADLSPDERDQVALALLEACAGIAPDWLPRLESAALAFGHEPAITAAVGCAFADRRLWGKARPLLEQAAAAPSLVSRTRRQCWRLLAAMAREDSDEARAVRCEAAAAAID